MTRTKFNEKMQKLMNNAWVLVKARNFTLAEAMRMAWKVYNLKLKGGQGRVEFDYVKKSTGELRHAVGTFNAKEMPKSATNFSGAGTYAHTPLQIRYFDVEKNGWRSCVEENIVAIY